MGAVIMGVMWFVNLVAATALVALRAPDWLVTLIWGYTAQGLLSGPIWFIAGILVLRRSEKLAEFVAKYAKSDTG